MCTTVVGVTNYIVRCELWVFFNKGVSCFGSNGSPSLLDPRAELRLVKSTMVVIPPLVFETGVECGILHVAVWLHRFHVLVVLRLR